METKKDRKRRTFLEIGASNVPSLLYLLDKANWWAHPIVDAHPYFFPKRETEWYGVFVEPHPQHLIGLKQALDHKKISQDSYKIYSGLVLGETKFVEFYTKSLLTHDSHSQIKTGDPFFSVPDGYIEGGAIVCFQSYTLDALLSDIASPVSLFRIDVEGAELEILLGFSFSQKPNMLIECHKNKNGNIHTADKVIEILEAQGYTVFPTAKRILSRSLLTLFAMSPNDLWSE